MCTIGQDCLQKGQMIGLLEVIQAAGREIGVAVTGVSKSGGSDTSYIAAKRIAMIRWIMSCRGHAQTGGEYQELNSLVKRSGLFAKTIARLTAQK